MTKEEEHAMQVLARLVKYLTGQNIGNGEFGRNAGFTIPGFNKGEYLQDFQKPYPNKNCGTFLDKYGFSKNGDKIRAGLSTLIDKGLMRKEPMDKKSYLYFPALPVADLEKIVKAGTFVVYEAAPKVPSQQL